MAFINLYSILDVENFASIKAVTKAFRKKALTAHPDRNKTADPAEFHKLLEAYEELKDPGKKALHDSRLRIISSVTSAGNNRRKRSLFSDMYFSFTRPRAAPPPKRRREQFGYPPRPPWFRSSEWTCDFGFNTNNPAFNRRTNGWSFQSEAWGRDGLSSSGGEAETELNRRRRFRGPRPSNTTRFSPCPRRKRHRSANRFNSSPSGRRPKVTINLVPEDLTGEPSSMGNPIDLTDDSPSQKTRTQRYPPSAPQGPGNSNEPIRVDNTARTSPVDLTWSKPNSFTRRPKACRVDLCSDKEEEKQEKPIDLTMDDEVKHDYTPSPLKDRTNDHYRFGNARPTDQNSFRAPRRHRSESFRPPTFSSSHGFTPLINLTFPY